MTRKLYIEVRSGLGNQLFQFAFSVKLFRETGLPIALLPVYYDGSWKRIVKRMLNKDSREFQLPYLINLTSLLNFSIIKACGSGHEIILDESNFDSSSFAEIVRNKSQDIKLRGYWQQPVQIFPYMKEISDLIEPQFELSHAGMELLNSQVNDSVALHVRRGDFLTNRAFGACTIEYYQLAIQWFAMNGRKNRFIIFTDDPNWVNRNFNGLCSFVLYQGRKDRYKDVEEFFVMSRFKNIITSNSTFSWWAAALNHKPKKVIIPQIWFLKKELQMDASKFRINDWLALENQLE